MAEKGLANKFAKEIIKGGEEQLKSQEVKPEDKPAIEKVVKAIKDALESEKK